MKKVATLILILSSVVLFSLCNKKNKASCDDGIKNQDEIEIDCGGSCAPCKTCSDGIKNQNETGIDCGGVCAACSSCSDNIQNQGETGVDCGGPCAPCPTGTNPATQNTNLQLGDSDWQSTNCSQTNSLTLQSVNGLTTAKLIFSPAIISGTYAITSGTPSSGTCAFTLLNAPGQPSNVKWFGKTGNVIVYVTSNAITAALSNVVCTQQNFNFPNVSVIGTMSCNP